MCYAKSSIYFYIYESFIKLSLYSFGKLSAPFTTSLYINYFIFSLNSLSTYTPDKVSYASKKPPSSVDPITATLSVCYLFFLSLYVTSYTVGIT